MEDRKNSSNRYDNERPIPKRRGRKPDKAKGSRRKKSSVWKVILASLILCLLAAAGTGAYILKGIIDQAPDITALSLRPEGFATTIYDSSGNETERLVMEGTNREEASYEEFPEDLVNAFIAIEDERFWTNKGIDIRAILRAVKGVLTRNSSAGGGSTITQQLIKNAVFQGGMETSFKDRLERKIQEQYLAVRLNQMVDKKTIMTNYLNTINLGSNTLGVKVAARRYFDKDVSDLTLSECAVLAGITKNPSKLNPLTGAGENEKRRKIILGKMQEQGMITEEEKEEALADDVYDRIQNVDVTARASATPYSYFTDEVIEQVTEALMDRLGYSEAIARKMLYGGGLSIYTTQDASIQKILDEEYADPSNYPDYVQYALDYALTVQNPDGEEINYSKEMLRLYFQNEDPEFDLLFDSQEEAQAYVDRYKQSVLADGSKVVAERVNFAPQPQSSMSVIDQHTGYVKAIVGGRGEKTASLTLNRATDTTRQPGSTFKVVSTYAPALNEKGMTLATTFEDEPYNYPDGSPVENASRTYGGTTTIRRAIQNSINVVAVKCLEEVTPELGLQYLDNFGFTTLAHGTEADTDANGTVWTDANLPLALGGLTHGVTNVELCAAYAAIANQGNYIEPLYYTKILDHNGNVLIEKTSAERSVIKESTAWLLTSAMEDVVKSGTGTACQLDNMTVAGKTGTTDDYNDLWFVGYTPYYTCAVWSGFDNNEKLPDDYSRDFHKDMWRKVMTRIHEGLEDKDFEMPSTVEKISVCADTGLLPRSGCSVITEFFDVGDVPTDYCEEHFYEPEPVIPEYTYDETIIPEPSLTPENPDENGDQGDGNTDNGDAGGEGNGGDDTGSGDTGGGDTGDGDTGGGDVGGGDTDGGDTGGGDAGGGEIIE